MKKLCLLFLLILNNYVYAGEIVDTVDIKATIDDKIIMVCLNNLLFVVIEDDNSSKELIQVYTPEHPRPQPAKCGKK